MKLTWYAPSGESRADMPVAELLAQVRRGGGDYWSVGSGGGLLERGSGEKAMEVYFVPRVGFHLILRDGRTAPKAAERSPPPERPKWAEIYVGGERMRISSRQTLSRPEAEQTLRHFAEHGTADPERSWQPVR
ncbi:MAG TPA: hypothetical protein VFP12_04990 [Allosphingosinicella sp.]|nr:hypothetical protein [Allosphingosinicella sp.]